MYKYLLSIISVFLLMVGALFCAPAVSAIDTSSSASEWVDYICSEKNLDSDDVVYMYREAVDEFNGEPYTQVCVFDVSNVPNVSFSCSTPSGEPVSDTHYAYKLYNNNCPFYINFYYWGDLSLASYSSNISSSSDDTWFSNISDRDSNYNYTYTNPVIWTCLFDNSYIISNSSFVDFAASSSPVVNKASYPIYKTLYSQYMLNKGLSIDSAFLADNNFNVVLQLPIVTSYSELDSDYVGFYCLSTVNTYTFKFELARTPGYIPSTEFFDTYLIIGYTLPTNTQCTCYFGTVSDFFHPFCFKRDDANQYITFTDFHNEERFAVSDTLISGFSVSASPGGNPITGAYTGIKWRVQSPAIELAPLYLSFIYSNVENGTITDGDGSDDYDGFKNTFVNNVTFNSYQSVSVPAPAYDGSYDITYDSNFLYLMDKIFNVDFISSMVVGVLAVSMACYIIFGKML